MTQETIGFIGVGLMGHGIAKNILRGGYPLMLLANRNRAPVDDLVSQGAKEAADLQELAEFASVIFLCLPGSPQVEATVAALLPHLREDTVIIDCSTSDPTSTLALATQLGGVGAHMVDTPLGGTPVQAEEGSLAIMAGGEEVIFARVLPVLETWAKAIVRIGGPGDGHKMKLLNNFLSLGYAALYSEAIVLGEKVGISTAQFDSVIRGSRMDCGFYQTYMGYVAEGKHDSHKFTLTNALKDLTYLESMADAAGAANPIGNAAKNSFAMAMAAGGSGAEDYVPHLVDFVAARNGVKR